MSDNNPYGVLILFQFEYIHLSDDGSWNGCQKNTCGSVAIDNITNFTLLKRDITL